MNYLKLLLSNIWVRIFGLIFSAILFLILFNILINSFIISPLETDVSNSKRGVSRYQVELSRLEKEISSIQSKISKKSKNSKAQYDHYYSLYSNPVRYINKFVLSDAKPNGLLIISSSVVPNVTFTSIDRARFKPFLKEYGINNDRNLPKFFRVFSVT
ncbi:MAG: hypothetical protein VW397_08465, partial [Candidatus Margulisiibacteriota bacterium]